jgi:hypothetical protein
MAIGKKTEEKISSKRRQIWPRKHESEPSRSLDILNVHKKAPMKHTLISFLQKEKILDKMHKFINYR